METGARIGQPHSSGRLRPGVIATVVLGAVLVGAAVGLAGHLIVGGTSAPGSSSAASASASSSAVPHSLFRGQATWTEGAARAPAITTLRDQTGRVFSLAALRGHTVAMAFFDSHCNQACPLEGRALAGAERSLPAAQRPVLVVVSVNPLDTPASTRAAARRWDLAQAGSWHWLRGTHAELARAWKAYHIFVAPPRDGDIAHTEALYLIDRRGDERSAYLYPFATRFVADDLRTLAKVREG
jgi:cytochrome oxidase Cu insertion factor (SCO1/SenC/PrrC family)